MNKKAAPRILVVHHADDYARDVSIFLEGSGFEASHCYSIRAAEEKLNSIEYDLIIASILLPDGNGLEFCRSLKKDVSNKDLKVILISSIPQSGRTYWASTMASVRQRGCPGASGTRRYSGSGNTRSSINWRKPRSKSAPLAYASAKRNPPRSR